MALFGVIGGPLLAASGVAVLMGVIPQGSPAQGLMTIPEIIWELYLGLWLTFKGFNAAAPILGTRSPGAGDQGPGVRRADRTGLRRRLTRAFATPRRAQSRAPWCARAAAIIVPTPSGVLPFGPQNASSRTRTRPYS